MHTVKDWFSKWFKSEVESSVTNPPTLSEESMGTKRYCVGITFEVDECGGAEGEEHEPYMSANITYHSMSYAAMNEIEDRVTKLIVELNERGNELAASMS